MVNLTQHLKVVGTEQAGMHPQLGCYLVVLKQIGEGRVFHSLLRPGQPPPEPKLLERMFKGNSELVSIPVTANTSLRHEFTSSVEHVSPGHSFEADYVLSFAVGSPDVVAARWIEDPVRRSEEEIKRLLDPAARKIDWDELRANIIRDGAESLCRNRVQEAIDDLRGFGQEYGLDIKSIHLRIRLSRTDAQPDADAADLGRKRLIDVIDKEKQLSKMIANHEVALVDVRHKAELRGLERPEQLYDAGLESAIEALKNVAANTNRGEDLTRTVREITSMITQHGGSGGTAARPALGAVERLALPSIAESDNKLALTIDAVLTLVDGLAGDSARKRELASVFLHLIAEACRNKEASADVADQYATRAADLVADWGPGLSPSQFTALNQFANFDLLRERLR